MLSIGNFSKVSNVTTKTLRYYDEIGLIKPAHINTENGYRYYDVSQLETILLINRLKQYSFSLEEISAVLGARYDDTLLFSLLRQKRQSTHEKMEELGAMLEHLETDIQNLERGIDIMAYLENIEVKLVDMAPKNILFVKEVISVEDYGKMMGRLFETIHRENLTPVGDPMTIYHEAEFNPASSLMEVAIPVKEVVTGTREFAPGLCAISTLKGPYSELPSVYAKLNEWMEKEGYSIASAPFEVYITNPQDTQPKDYVTEVYIPVKK
ncbi:MAG: MerR family transcriptional regulator [Oscillospiraceae bacterium]